MRILFAVPLLFLALPAAALDLSNPALPRDTDTACAATFTMLSANARAHGFASSTLEAVARAAQSAHLRHNPREDARLYFAHVAAAAQQLRQSFSDGSLPFAEVQAQQVNCHVRYDSRQMMAAAF